MRKIAPYENWRPPLVGVFLLVPVETSHLLVAELRGDLLVPCGPAHNGLAPERAAQSVLLGAPSGIPVLRRVAVDWVQMRRRQVFTYVVAAKPLTYADAACLTYRDGRANLLVLPTVQATSALPALARARVHAALKALAEEETAYLEAGIVSHTEPARLTGSRERSVEIAVRGASLDHPQAAEGRTRLTTATSSGFTEAAPGTDELVVRGKLPAAERHIPAADSGTRSHGPST